MFVAEGARGPRPTDVRPTWRRPLNPAVEAGLALGLDIDAIIDHVLRLQRRHNRQGQSSAIALTLRHPHLPRGR